MGHSEKILTAGAGKTERCVKMSDLKDCEDDNMEDNNPLADNLNNEEKQNFPEGYSLYLDMVQYMDENERQGGNWPLEEDDNETVSHFLKVFPAQRKEIEKCISCIREMADHVDKIHKDCTIATITASSAGATSSILTILGMALMPVTAGASLILTATGIGVGAAAAVTGVSANVCEHFINSKKSQKAQELINKCEERINRCKESLTRMIQLSEVPFHSGLPENKKANIENFHCCISDTSQIPKLASSVKEIMADVKAFGNLEVTPALKTLGKGATSAIRRSIQTSVKWTDNVDHVFKGNALAISKGARVVGGISAAAVLLFSVYCIVKDALHLAKGAKATMAAKIREKASNLEDILQKLDNLCQELEHTSSN
uniref:Apolipoprotein L2-like isoform X1 n=1 Tax=Pogona vitticeps TaxID=103695 RepID=A0A6J0T3R4_9SAUR